MVEEATVDCYNEEEQVSGLFTMIEENVSVSFETQALGVSLTVTSVDSRPPIVLALGSSRQDATQLRQA